ncbi:MAG TPA: DUF6188 family protein [Candidatus Limnocylindria bacterium]|nr:DUF6188 family protein [Candidatus Limnocylindria bacterium]
MHGLPADLDLSFLVGAVLVRVEQSAHQPAVRLYFDGDVWVGIEATFRVATEMRDVMLGPSDDAATALAGFIGDSIQTAHGQTDGTLTINFSAAGLLELYDSSTEFECYQIHYGGSVLPV